MHQGPDDIPNAQRAVLDSRRDESDECLVDDMLFPIDPELYFGAEIMHIFIVETEKTDQFSEIVSVGFRPGAGVFGVRFCLLPDRVKAT